MTRNIANIISIIDLAVHRQMDARTCWIHTMFIRHHLYGITYSNNVCEMVNAIVIVGNTKITKSLIAKRKKRHGQTSSSSSHAPPRTLPQFDFHIDHLEYERSHAFLQWMCNIGSKSLLIANGDEEQPEQK